MNALPDPVIEAIEADIEAHLERKGIRGRVLDRVNRHGETVVGVILDPPARRRRSARVRARETPRALAGSREAADRTAAARM
jgi:hypothetical protein